MTKLQIACAVSAWALCAALAMPGDGLAQEKQMYQWTDQDGVVHFSDTAPEGMDVPAKNIPMNDQPAGLGNQQAPPSGPSAAQQRREDIAQKSAEGKANRAALDAQCAAWQAEVDRLEPNRRVFSTNEQGETERMDDVVRTNRVAELKAQIAKNCR
ncbi:MAG: DUF4124 domain-containing protein [Xanthomonadales bacterium]|jgi:anti-sigma28 factor (negative regulator of flagellin synthesis)|nr:DUF4124 domain-containing protein [Xanthomonadales bacterium]